MKTIKDYHDLYLKCNVLLLADAFEMITLEIMDYVQVIIEPGLSWDAILETTKVKLVIDPDMYMLLEKGTRNGICDISNRYKYLI